MAARCKRRPILTTVSVLAASSTPTVLELPASTAEFLLRPRTAVGLQVRLDPASGDYFSIGASETYTEERLALDDALVLHLSAGSDVVVEVWRWDG